MKASRILLTGSLIWLSALSLFTIMSFIPGIKDSGTQQEIIVAILIIPVAIAAATFYYKPGITSDGFITGLAITATALTFDVLITVPFFEIPAGRGYVSFFTNPMLWIIAAENLAVFYLYHRLKVKSVY